MPVIGPGPLIPCIPSLLYWFPQLPIEDTTPHRVPTRRLDTHPAAFSPGLDMTLWLMLRRGNAEGLANTIGSSPKSGTPGEI